MPKTTPLVPMAEWLQVESTPADWDAAGRDELLRMHFHLHLIRAFEEAVLHVHNDGLVHGPAHSSIGQEGGAVGSIAPLRPSDQVSGPHRGHHQFLAKALGYVDSPACNPLRDPLPGPIRVVLRRTLAEIMGLAEGYCKGRGGSMHLRWAEAGALGTNAIVGGGVPFANGVAWALKRKGRGDVAFTYFGDGGVNIGSVPESLNLAALWNLPICFFIENNGYAVSTTLEEETREIRMSSRGLAYGIPSYRVDGMDPIAVRVASEKALEIMRSGKGPVLIEAVLYRFMHHGGGTMGSAFGYRTKAEEAEWKQRDPLARVAKEMMARNWLTADEDAAIRNMAKSAMDEIIDELTIPDGNKRKVRTELWPDIRFRDAGLRGDLSEFRGARFEEQESFSGKLAETKFIDAVSGVMNRRMETDERIFCIGEDIHKLRGGTNGATKGLAQRFPDRIVPTPIAELGFSGLAGGVASEGTYRPVVELMYPDFSLVAADQLFNQIAKARHMFGGETRMPLVLRTKCALGSGYGSQHSMDPAGLYSNWPGWRIVAPSTPFDYVGLMNSALLCEDPVLMIEHVDLYTTTGIGPAEDLDYYIPFGKAKVVRPGTQLTVLTYLSMVPLAKRVAEEMGIDAEIIDLRSLDRAGLDWETIGVSIRKTNNVVVLEQGPLTVSYGALLADEVQRRYMDWLDQPVKRIHGGESSPSVSKVLERAAFVGAEEIGKGLAEAMADRGERQWLTAQ
jgi:2-oxoisovalerate dehydrogenase E1 component